jgi:hypothetical protein
MGWTQLGRPSIAVRPGSLSAIPKLRQARTSAEKWSEPCSVGVPATEALAEPSLPALLQSLPPRAGWSTPRTAAHLQWRYRFEPLHYRAIEAGGGLAIFRVRGRGGVREVAITEWLAPRADRRAIAQLARHAGDYAVAVGIGMGHGLVPLRRQGPILTWRPLARVGVPELDDLDVELGDLELL